MLSIVLDFGERLLALGREGLRWSPGSTTVFEEGALLMVGNWTCPNRQGRTVVRLRAGAARQQTGKMLSGISLSPLSPQWIRCSEISLCFATFSC